ncbi:MAG: N-formylglutamate deformylase [Nitratireductor sp.]|nr:N-formylglutamate deformylase [Nitratireductor sp.]
MKPAFSGPVEVKAGDGPVVLGMPHTGTWLPANIASRLNANGRLLADTDWHIDRLYGGLLPHGAANGATVVRAIFHRYCIDANRDPTGTSLYPGQNTTTLVPLTDFDGEPIWREEPDEIDIAVALERFHRLYHRRLHDELLRVRDRHGVAILYDCHSIRSQIPFLFEGRLPDFNIGTADGLSCSPAIEKAVADICERAEGYTCVVNGRFRGGWTTRHYGRPEEGIHAIQMELAQATHLESEAPPFNYDGEKTGRLRVHLAQILETLNELALSGALTR